MQNIRLTLQYDGTRYLGWQRPKKDGFEKTVSYKVTTALSRMTGEDITLYPGAKTDPGVHARSQTVSFLTGSSLSPEQIRTELNRFLPQDIAVLSSGTAPERFRADLNAKSRTYGYRICTSPVYDIFTAAFTACISPCPDISRMEAAAALLTGTHDFRFFSASRGKKGTGKNILDIRFEYEKESCFPGSGNPDTLVISLTADDFLSQMPQRIIGTLLEIGMHKRAADEIPAIFAGKACSSSCDAKGLLLTDVRY